MYTVTYKRRFGQSQVENAGAIVTKAFLDFNGPDRSRSRYSTFEVVQVRLAGLQCWSDSTGVVDRILHARWYSLMSHAMTNIDDM